MSERMEMNVSQPGGSSATAQTGTPAPVSSKLLAVLICGAGALLILLIGKAVAPGVSVLFEAPALLLILFIHDVQHSLEQRTLSWPSLDDIRDRIKDDLGGRGSDRPWYQSALFYGAGFAILLQLVPLPFLLLLGVSGSIVSLFLLSLAAVGLGWRLAISRSSRMLLTLIAALYLAQALSQVLDFIVLSPSQYQHFHRHAHSAGSMISWTLLAGTWFTLVSLVGYVPVRLITRHRVETQGAVPEPEQAPEHRAAARCSSCGRLIDATDPFCRACGARQAGAATRVADSGAAMATTRAADSHDSQDRSTSERVGAAVAEVTLSCSACRTPHRPGAKFCGNCGAPLAQNG